MARPGGNPQLKQYQFTSDRDEPLTAKFTLRVSAKMLAELKGLGDQWREFVRQAIAEKLARQDWGSQKSLTQGVGLKATVNSQSGMGFNGQADK